MLDSLSEKVLKYIILNSRHPLVSTEIIDTFSTEPLNSVKDALGNLFQKNISTVNMQKVAYTR
ncbi:hypothetical protein EBGED10_57780 [Bacillus sp. GeD10]|nr:hypothetical protein EBGED10_57780 [Bacillus sp. GeD10]